MGALLSLFASRHPHIVGTMQSAIDRDGGRTDDTNEMSEIYRELPVTDFSRRSVMDDATQRRRLRNEVKQSRQLQVILAHAALVPAILGG
jgi:hypothetical protein